MRILYGFTAPQSARAFLRGQAQFMASEGFEVHVASGPGPELEECHELYGVGVHSLPMSREINLGADLISLVGWFRILRAIRPDVVNMGTPKASLLGLFAAFILRVPKRVYVVRGLRYEGAQGLKRQLLQLPERINCMTATDVVVVSRSVGQLMRDDRITNRPLSLIGSGSSNGVDYDSWQSRVVSVDRDKVRDNLRIPRSVFVGIFVGRITQDKGISTLVEMLRECGFGPDRFVLLAVGRVESEKVRLQLEEVGASVKLAGYQKDMAPFFAISDALILPTRREGFPNVVLEAAACGVPTITSNATGAVDSVKDNETGLINPVDNGARFADSLVRLVSSPGLAKQMGNAAASRVRSEFSGERVWRGLASIYSGRPNADISHL